MPPMRRIGLLVTWELLDPLHPGRDAGKACLEGIKPQRQWSCLGAPRGPHQELQARIGDDIGGSEIEARQPNAAFGTFFQPGETEVNLLALFFRLVGGEWRSEKDRAVETLAGRPEIGDELRDTLKNPASFLGSAPESGGFGCLRSRYTMIARDSWSVKLPSRMAGTRPRGLMARNSGVLSSPLDASRSFPS